MLGGSCNCGLSHKGCVVLRHHSCDYHTGFLLLPPSSSSFPDRLVGLVVKASASRAEDPGLESRLRQGFFRSRVIPVT